VAPEFDLFGFGIVAVDDIVELDQFPVAGGKQRYQRLHRHPGGITGTALVSAARLGARCAYGGNLGHDELASYIRTSLAAEGIEVLTPQHAANARPYHSIILVERATGERTILDSNAGVIAHTEDSIPEEWITNARGLFIDWLGIPAGIAAARIARARSIPVFADMESVADDGRLELLALTDHLIVPLAFATALTGEGTPELAVRALARPARACTAVTDGPRGAWFTTDGTNVQHQLAFSVDAVDTTGCGDVFHGAYAAAILAGDDIPASIRFAAAAAALKATQPGGQAGIPNRPRVEAMLTQ
jgi:sulfofructose kinase